jgi:hypothetical protein
MVSTELAAFGKFKPAEPASMPTRVFRGRRAVPGTSKWSMTEMAGPPTLKIDYEFIAGKHFFTAATKFARGLCVAHDDLGTALDEVRQQLQVILSENHGVEHTGVLKDPGALEEFKILLDANPGAPQRITWKTFGVNLGTWTSGRRYR